MRRERFFQKCFQTAQAKLAHPIRIFFDIRDVVNSSLAQSGASIAHVSFRIREISFASINIDCRSFGFHCEFYPVYLNAGSTAPFACPIVSSLLELQSEFFSPASNDSPCYHYMDVVGDDVVQKALIVRN